MNLLKALKGMISIKAHHICSLIPDLILVCTYHIAGNFDEGKNIDGLASFRSLTGEVLTDSLLDNLYLLYN